MMSEKKKKLQEMQKLTQLIEDADIARLREAATARQATLDALMRISNRTPVDPYDTAALCAQSRHRIWQEQQRRILNVRLAQQTVAWAEARSLAARAVGRNHAVGQLAQKPPK